MARRSGFTSPQRDPDIERLRQEVEREHARVLRLIDGLTRTIDQDVTSAVGASFVVANNTLALANERALVSSASVLVTDNGPGSTIVPSVIEAAIDHGGLGGLSGDDHTQYVLADGSRALTSSWDVGTQDIYGIDALGAVDSLFSGSSHAWSAASPTLTIGDGTGAPTIVIDKSNASSQLVNWNVAGTTRGSIAFSSAENFLIRLHDGAGAVAYTTNYLTSNGAWTFPALVTAQAANAQDLGDTTNYWRSVIAGATWLRDGVTAPGATANYAKTYVDTSDGMLKTVFGDSAIATVAPGVTCQSVVVVARDTTDVSVVNTTSVTAVFTGTVPANSMGTSGVVRCTIVGEFFNNSGASRNFSVRIAFGGTTDYQDTAVNVPASTSTRGCRIVFEIVNRGATNSQALGGLIVLGAAGAVTTGIAGDLGTSASQVSQPIVGSNLTVTTTVNRDVVVSVIHAAADANLSFTKRYALLELAPT